MGILGEKEDIDCVYMYTAVYFNVLYLRRQAFFLVSFTKHNQPVQCIVVLQILCSPATLHIFDYMVLQKLFEELHCLLSCDIWAKVAVAAKQLVEPVHSSWGSEAGSMVTKVLAVFPDRHTSPKQTSHFIPLKNKKDYLEYKKNNNAIQFIFKHFIQIRIARRDSQECIRAICWRLMKTFVDFKHNSTSRFSTVYKKNGR